MSSYNLTKRADRDQLRADRQAELDAVKTGAWPRDLNDECRWNECTSKHPAKYAAEMCQADITYLDGVERRLRDGDPDLQGWEGWQEKVPNSQEVPA